MGLFSKKSCSVCGGDIGLLGNRKLEDGNLCKDCAAKLSPFFRERRTSTVAEIEEQLAYRKANEAEVAAFHVTRSLGGRTKVLFDEDAQKFIVTSKTRWSDGNPDVMSFSDVTGCYYKIDENKREVEKEVPNQTAQPAAGARVGAAPVNARMGGGAKQPTGAAAFAAQRNAPAPQPGAFGSRLGTNASGAPQPPRPNPGVVAAAAPAQPQTYTEYEYSYDFDMTINVNNLYFDTITFQVNDNTIDSTTSVEYTSCLSQCEEIKAVLTGIREDIRSAAVEAATPKMAVTCSHCGATSIPDANGRCEYCGGSVL